MAFYSTFQSEQFHLGKRPFLLEHHQPVYLEIAYDLNFGKFHLTRPFVAFLDRTPVLEIETIASFADPQHSTFPATFIDQRFIIVKIYFADFFLDKANKELGRDIIGFSPEAMQLIRQYTWPGNLRQMANVVKRAVLLAQGRYIAPRELDIEVNAAVAAPISVTPLRDSDDERQRIIEALRVTGNNKSKAAELLQIDRKTLYNKMKLYGL